MKRIIALTIIFTAALLGCGKKNEPSAIPTTAPSVSMVEETVTSLENESSLETETSVEVDMVNDDSAKRHEEYVKWREYISPKKKDEVDLDDESENLYAGFLSGDISAEYVIEGDRTEFFNLSDVLKDGQSYTLNELIAKVNKGIEDDLKWYYDGNISERYVDLGLDGKYELLTTIGSCTDNLILVVKNYNGKLKICFSGEFLDPYSTEVLYTGRVGVCNPHRHITHSYEEGYIDKDGNYHIWWKGEEDAEGDSLFEDLAYDDSFLEANPVEDGTTIFVDKISFNDDFSDEFYSISIWDKDDNYLDENNPKVKDVYSTIRNEFEQSEKKVVTRDEAVKMQEEQRKAIGYSDELYTYGDELRPEEN